MGEFDELPADQNPFGDSIGQLDSEFRYAFGTAYLKVIMTPSPLWRRISADVQ